MEKKLHYGWIVIFMGLMTTVAAHGFGRMAYTLLLPAMKDGLSFDYTQLGLLGTGNFIGYLSMAIIGGFLAARFGTRAVITAALGLMGVTMILTGLAQSFGFAFAMRLLTGLGNGAGGLWAMIGGLSIFCGVIWGSISDRIGRGRGAALAYLVLGTSYLVYALVKVEAGFYISAILFGLTAWSIPTIMAAAAGDFAGPRFAPAALGFITLFFGIGQSIGPALGGYLADTTQSLTTPFLVAGAISLCGMIFSLFLKKPAREQ